MAYTDTLPSQGRFGQTVRQDAWWVQPLAVFLGFAAFIVYSTWAAFQGKPLLLVNGNGADYLSPFYSPEIFGASPILFSVRLRPGGRRGFPFSPAFLILWVPAGFRLTCYYYRGAYYKAFWADPLELRRRRTAQGLSRRTPLPTHHAEHPPLFHVSGRDFHFHPRIRCFQGDVVHGSDRDEAFWHRHRNVGFNCKRRSARRLTLSAAIHCGISSAASWIETSRAPACAKGYACVSCLNRRHMLWAWLSLFWVGFADVYIRLCAMDKISRFYSVQILNLQPEFCLWHQLRNI